MSGGSGGPGTVVNTHGVRMHQTGPFATTTSPLGERRLTSPSGVGVPREVIHPPQQHRRPMDCRPEHDGKRQVARHVEDKGPDDVLRHMARSG